MSVAPPLDALRPSTGHAPAPGAEAALELFGSMLSHATVADAGKALVRELAARLSFDAVHIGLRKGLHVELLAASDGVAIQQRSPATERLTAAMEEALDQRASLALPDPRVHAQPRITLAHRHLLEASPGASVITVPIVVNGGALGALIARRSAGRTTTASDLQALEGVACLCAPVLELMQRNERGPAARALDACRHWRSTFASPARLRWTVALVACVLAIGALALVPAPLRIGGQARLEGAVQRVLVAPADGFLRQVNARPGDRIVAGQTLIELATQDLRLEATRWENQIAQYQGAYAAANARADRSQWVINQAKAAEAEGQLALVTTRLERSNLQAPFDGVVVRGDLSQSLGAPVAQGTELMTLAPRDRYRVIVEVDERDIGHIRAGQTGSLALSAMPWNTLPIAVKRITPLSTALEGRNVFEVEAELLEQPTDLRPGMQGSARIVAGRQPLLWSWTRRVVDGVRLAVWEQWG